MEDNNNSLQESSINSSIIRESPNFTSGHTPTITYGEAPNVKIHLIDDNELNSLENGITASLELNFSIALLACSLTCFTTTKTVVFSTAEQTTYLTFLVIAFVSLIIGCYLLLKWYFSDKVVKKTIQGIKDRIKNA